MAAPLRRRPALAALLATLLALGVPAAVLAESLLWTLVASPLAVTTGVETTFTLTATNEDPAAALISDSEIGCLYLDVPPNFSVKGAAVTGSNAGDGWRVDWIVGNRVKVHTDSGGDRLKYLDWVRFTVTATATSTGSLAWNARAYRDQGCGGSGTLLAVPPVVVVSDPLVTPTPTPTPRPTATATPTPTPTPLLTLPTLEILPTPTPAPTATPTPTPAGAPGASPTPTPSTAATSSQASPESGTTSEGASPSEDEGEAGTPATAGGADGGTATIGAGDAGGAATGPRVSFDRAALGVELGPIGMLDGAGIWAVPAATIAGPGLLILLFIALQAAGVAAWIPAVRRLRGKDERPS